ncbi:MAG TPA: deoxyribodipyrimidine photo-lyase [Bryobacteraceae bacterium]|jgi:deoxyribodipyrimidine photo-lyase|nr:deoxyribodipyrimidine photo-lyase [Bryobacteraceae bacterium]
MSVETERISKLNGAPERPERKYILYWAQMNRRVDANHGLLYAAELANRRHLPVLYYEGLTCSYDYANDRLHTFILEGVPHTARRLKTAGIGYVFYLRATRSAPNHALYDLARDAAAIVTDDYPAFIARDHNARVPPRVDVAYYAVDSSCIVPMKQIPERQYGAYTIRPKIKRLLPRFLKQPDVLRVKRRYEGPVPALHTEITRNNIASLVASCEIDHSIPPSVAFRGGCMEAGKLLDSFLANNLARYALKRNQPSEHATSHMSPYLHFGQISSLEIALAVQAYAKRHKLIADEYLEELIVRRELAFNYAAHVDKPGSLENLPDWCQVNLRKHARDKRDPAYTPEQLQRAETYDELWNATQKEMLFRGKIHGYYRMYWGKKIIEWSRTYQEAVDTMIDIHGRYALDGRDPNTYTNILWCFGLHDRPWFERPIFGTMRYMSLEGMKRKTDTAAYIEEIRQLDR